MNKIYALALAFLLLSPCFLSAKNVAVLETSIPTETLTVQEQARLTDVLHEQAVSALPADQDWNITVREIGSADYVVQAHVAKLGKLLAISAELLESASGKVVSSFAGTGNSADELEKVVTEQAPAFFKKITETSWSGFGTQETQEFGYLNLIPQIADEFRNNPSLSITIDGKKAFLGQNKVAPGIHTARIEHACFDPVEFNSVIQKDETKTISDSLVRGLSGLDLEVTKNGEPQAVVVFVDGNQAGTTPFATDIPLCSKVEIEYNGERKEIPVQLKWHEIVKVSYELEQKPEAAVAPVAEAKPKTEAPIAEPVNKKAEEVEAQKPATKKNANKRFWGGLTAGILYNDFHGTQFGLKDIPQGKDFSISVDGADKLLQNFWGVGFKMGVGGLFTQSQYLSLRGDLNIALRQGTSKANTAVILSWKDHELGKEKSDLKLEYSITQLNIDIPMLARVSIPNTLYFEAGPMFSFNVYSENKSTITDIYGSETYEENGGLSAFEFDIATGIGVMQHIGKSILDIDLRFVLGLTRISSGKDSPKTWQGQLNITYWFL